MPETAFDVVQVCRSASCLHCDARCLLSCHDARLQPAAAAAAATAAITCAITHRMPRRLWCMHCVLLRPSKCYASLGYRCLAARMSSMSASWLSLNMQSSGEQPTPVQSWLALPDFPLCVTAPAVLSPMYMSTYTCSHTLVMPACVPPTAAAARTVHTHAAAHLLDTCYRCRSDWTPPPVWWKPHITAWCSQDVSQLLLRRESVLRVLPLDCQMALPRSGVR